MDELLVNIEVNIAAAREHVGEVQRKIRTAKERGRLIVNKLPYSYLQSHIIIHLVYFILMLLNLLPDFKEIYQNYSPR